MKSTGIGHVFYSDGIIAVGGDRHPDGRGTAPHFEARDDQSDECLSSLSIGIEQQLHADGVHVVWHQPDRKPVVLFRHGEGEPGRPAERDRFLGLRGAGLTSVAWSDPDATSDGATLTGRVRIASGLVEIVAVFLSQGRARRKADQTLSRLLPMLGAFFSLWASRARSLAGNQGLKAALNSSDVPTVLVDPDGLDVFVNDAAERLIGCKDGLFRKGRQLTGRRVADTIRLQSAIEHVVHGSDARKDGTPVVALSRESGRALLAVVISADQPSPEPGSIAAIVRIFDPEESMDKLLEPVCRLYGMTVVEGRLASLLAQGSAFADAARKMRVQEQTARSYLKQIFAKTETNRQSELVGLMLRSAVRTAPDLHLNFI